MLNDITAHATLPAADMDRAKEWYAEKLDLKPVDQDWGGVWYETTEGSRFYLYPSEYAGTNQATAISFVTGERFDDVASSLRDKGVEFFDVEFEGMSTQNGILTGPTGTRHAWFEDSEGNILAIDTE